MISKLFSDSSLLFIFLPILVLVSRKYLHFRLTQLSEYDDPEIKSWLRTRRNVNISNGSSAFVKQHVIYPLSDGQRMIKRGRQEREPNE